VPRSFASALEANPLPLRLGDVRLQYEKSLWVGRADKPPRGKLANAALIVGCVFGVLTLAAIVRNEDHASLGMFLLPAALGFSAAAWLEQRERRQRAFAVDFHGHVLRLDFSTPLTGMPRTLHVAFDEVRELQLEDQGGGLKVMTVDFEAGKGLYREVLVADVTAKQLTEAERVKKMLRAAVGLEKPKDEEPTQDGPPPPLDTFGP
jgi:hypothetical protein